MNVGNLTSTYFATSYTYAQLHYFYILTCIPVGIVANLFTIAVYSRAELNKSNAGFLNKCIATTNLFILLFHLLVIESRFWLGVDLVAYSNLSCKLVRIIKKATREASPMIETALILSRYFEVFRPKQFTFTHKKLFLTTSVVLIYTSLFLINSENLFYFKTRVTVAIVYDSSGNSTLQDVYKCTSFVKIMALSELISAIFRSILPSVAMFVLNSLIITRLFQSKAASNRQTRPNRELKFARSTLLRNFIFILLNLPYTVVSMFKITHLIASANRGNENDDLYTDMFDTALGVCYDISTFYYVSFFFINAAFNKLFRYELLVIVGLRQPRRGTRRRGGLTTMNRTVAELAAYNGDRTVPIEMRPCLLLKPFNNMSRQERERHLAECGLNGGTDSTGNRIRTESSSQLE